MAKNKKKKSKQEVEKNYGTGIAPVSNKFTINVPTKNDTKKTSTKKSTKKKESTKNVDTLEDTRKNSNVTQNKKSTKTIAPVEIKTDDRFTIKTPEIQRTEEQQKEFDKKTKKAQKQATTDTKYVGKKATAGLSQGVTGIVDAPLQNIQEGMMKGEQDSLLKNIGKVILSNYDNFGVFNLPEIGKNAYNRFKNDDLTTWQKISQTGLELMNNGGYVDKLESVGRIAQAINPVTKIYNKVTGSNVKESEMFNELRNYVNKPNENIQEWAEKDADKVSKTGKTIGGAVQTTTNMIPSIAASIITHNPNIGLAVMGVSAKGSATREAERQGMDLSTANDIGNAKALVEVATEKISSGAKIFGAGELDDIVEKGINSTIKNKFVNYLAKQGAGIAGEIVEETISDIVDTAIDKGTINPDASYSFDDWKETGLMTTLSTLLLNSVTGGYSPSTYTQNATELEKFNQSDNVQKIIEVELEDRLNNEYNGKASAREIAQLQKEIIEDIQNGYISTDTIEKTLGGDTYNQLNEYNQKALKLQEEVNELQQKADKNELDSLEEKQKLEDLKKQIKEIDNTELKTQLTNEVNEIIKNDKGLQESYLENNRRKENFFVDLNTIQDETQRSVYQKAMDSGVLNNSNKTHALVDMIAKISAEKNINFDFTNNEQLENSGFGVNGRNINGYVTDSGITINLNSSKAINRIVGHELTHTFEGTTLYTELQDSLKDFLGSQWDNMIAEYKDLYKGVKNANIENELTSDLIGDYLFTDENYVRSLSTAHRNLFQKIYDEIKYLYNVATAGSKERRMLEKVKKTFDRIYNETESKTTDDTKMSIERNKKGYYVKADRQVITGNDPEVWQQQVEDYINDSIRNGKDVNVIAADGDILTITEDTAGKAKFRNEITLEDGSKRQLTDEELLTKLVAETHIDELGKISKKINKEVVPDYKNHNFAKDGFDYRIAYFEDYDGQYYRITMSVGKNGDINTIYNIGKMKNLSKKKETGKFSGSKAEPVSLKQSISQSNENVKLSISKDSQGRQLNENQREYFKNSKVVDKNGNLKVMYNGGGDYTTFDNTKMSEQSKWGKGIYLTEEQDIARMYGDNVKEVYANIENPINQNEKTISFEKFNELSKALYDEEAYREEYDMYDNDLDLLWDITNKGNWADYGEQLRDIVGVDGLIIEDSNPAERMAIAFNSNQIKNVSNETPTSNADIRYDLSVSEAKTTTDNNGRKLSKEQKEYFKDSVAVDNDGNLITVYHTTTGYTHQFNEFNPVGTPGYRFEDQTVNYYTNSKDMSGSYADQEYEMANTKRLTSMDDVKELLGDRYTIEENNGRYELYDKNDFTQLENYKKVIKSFNKAEQDILNRTFNKSRSEVRELLNNDEAQFDFYDETRVRFLNELYNENEKSGVKLSGTNKTIDEIVDNYLKNKKINSKMTFYDNDNLYRDITNWLSNYNKYQYEGYVNITNPYVIDADGENWDSVSNTIPRNVQEEVNRITNNKELKQALTDLANKSVYNHNELYSQEEQERYDDYRYKAKLIEDSELQDAIQTCAMFQFEYDDYASKFDYLPKGSEGINEQLKSIPFGKNETISDFVREYGQLYKANMEYGTPESYFKQNYKNILGKEIENLNSQELFNIAFQDFREEFYEKELAQNNSTNDVVNQVIEMNKNGANYDGVIIKNVVDYGGKTDLGTSANDLYITFNSNQFKTVDNTNPTVDPDIRYSLSQDSQGRELSEGQQEYFKDSKVRDENGNLEVVYHQTNNDFTIFKNGFSVRGFKNANFFTNEKPKQILKNMLEGYVKIDNPLYLENTSIQQSIVDNAIKNGYDGIINQNVQGIEGKNEIVTFNSNQFKNIDNLNPTSNEDIRYSLDRIPISKNLLTQAEQDELDGLRAVDNSGFSELTPEETSRMLELENRANTILNKKAEKMLRSGSYKAINTATKVAQNYLDFDAQEKKSFRNQLREFSNMTKDELVGADTYNKVKDIVSQYANREYTYFDDTVEGIKRELKHTKIKVTDDMKNQITDYGYFVRDSKLMLRRNSGTPVDQVYQEYSEMYPNFFDADVWNEADELERLNEFMNHDFSVTEKYRLTDEDLKNATDIIYNKLLDNSLSQQDLITTEEVLDKKVQKRTRTVVREELLNKMGITPETIQAGKDISAIDFARTDPIRVNEKVFGWKTGQLINDATVNFTKHQEAERMRFLNKERQEIKDLGIKARSKESELVQKYGEKQYVDKNNEVHPYTDAELNRDVKDVATREKIKNAARVLRQKYDTYIDKVNSVLTEMGYDEIPKRQDYMRHFVELDDKFSRWGLPFNPESMSAEDLPTDINGLTEFNRPGKSYFASANTRTGLQTTYDAITGIDGYLEGVSNLIYHTESIQRYRALTRFIRENYGREHGLDNIDLMTDEELAERIKDIQDNKLSKYVAWLDEQANSIAGKKGSLDRSVERMFGRRIYTALNTLKSQVGSNMTGFNVRSAMTNFASAIQGASKTQKLAFVKGTVSTINNIIHDDGMINKSDFLTRRLLDTQSLALKPWQKISQAGQIFMNGTDYFTANQIWRSKYYENLSKGMSEQQAITNADDFAARIMGDRSKGSTAELFNSKTLGFLSQFQLEVNNQWSSLIHDNKIDIQKGNKTALGVTFELGQLFAASYLFNTLMKELTGSDVMIDPIDMLLKIFKPDDDDKDEGIVKRAQKVLGELINNLPFANLITGGGRIPISEAFTGVKTLGNKLIGGTDNYGNEITWGDVKDDALESLAYWVMPTGYGQLKKTVKGLSMYDDKLPIAGSYTDSGNLRFSAEDTAYGKVKAGLFGQYSSKYAQDYIDSGYKSINASKLDEMKDLDMNSTEYREYRSGLSAAGSSVEDKLNYISDLDVSDEDKTIMASNVAKKDIDMSEYKKYGSYEEFNYAQKNPAKYEVMKLVGGYDTYKNYEKEIESITADYDRNGKAITNSRKNKVIKYVNSLNLTKAQKAMLIKEQYPSFTQYDSQIASYVNNQNMSFIQKAGILKQLGFKAYDKQIINYIKQNYRTVEEQQEELEKLGFKIYTYNGKTYVR